MVRFITAAVGAVGGLLVAAGASAATVTTLLSDFESPTFVVGDIGGNPPYSAGQGGWGGFNSVIQDGQLLRARIVDDRAFSGAQSLRTTSDGRTINKALDATGTDPYNSASGGEWPSHSGGFTLHSGYDWWVRARVWINPGASARFSLLSGLGGCPILDIGDFGSGGASSPGEVYANSCTGFTGEANLGSAAFGQWLLLEMVHTTAMGAGMEFRITGAGLNRVYAVGSYSGPGSGSPAYVGLAGDAYWDDVMAGYGAAPPVVPVPGAVWLMASALGALAAARRGFQLRSSGSLPR